MEDSAKSIQIEDSLVNSKSCRYPWIQVHKVVEENVLKERSDQRRVNDLSCCKESQIHIVNLRLVELAKERNNLTASDAGRIKVQPDVDHIRRRIIRKKEKLVCHARCVLVWKGIRIELLDVMDGSARIGLDVLMKH
ncbi:hypothetical protein VNO77_22774 [Canavalia gladiata]|uniref:Uncharacterized protein n=1 Tax=Canavalia gladiata TaxID=3824 RepID=A0AAN9L383_CANGL